MSSFFREYLEILEDPAHLAVEVTMMIVLDGIILGLLWPMVRRFIDGRLQRQHAMLDAEHGVRHHADHVDRAGWPAQECEDAVYE